MYLSNIKLWNFRKFGSDGDIHPSKPNLDLNFNHRLNVIIGENDSGKTAIIDAVKLVLKTHSFEYIKVDSNDFYKSANHLRIELTFSDLQDEEAKHFTEWLGWEGVGTGIKSFLKLTYDVKRDDNRIYPSDVKAGLADEGFLLTAEAKDYLKATYLKPLRDAENELIAKKNSRLSQILIGHEAFKGQNKDHELVEIFNQMCENLTKYFKGELETKENPESTTEDNVHSESKSPNGKIIKDRIDTYIKQFYGNDYESEFDTQKNDIKSILEKLTLSIKEQFNPGLGTLNRLCMAAELLHLNKENWSGLRLGLIEELEAHLHPQAQMQVIESLQKQDKIQLILTTHSPNLASKVKLENLIICNNNNAFPMGSAYTELDSEDYAFLEKFLDTTKSNLFFAKGIILVEGWAEEIIIPSLAKNIGINLTERGISVVNIGSTAFNRYSKIFLRKEAPYMTIPVSVITDSDIREYGFDSDKKFCKKDPTKFHEQSIEKISRIESNSQGNVKYFVAPKWTLEYSLFQSQSMCEAFIRALNLVHPQTATVDNIEETLAKKLLFKTLKKTEVAYEVAKILDVNLTDQKDQEHIVLNRNNKSDSISYLIEAIEYATGN